jgi:hypothetical protein
MSSEEKSLTTVLPANNALMEGRPDFLAGTAPEGTEHIGKDDLKIPRLSIAQGLSNQMKRADPRFIEGLAIGDLFNDLTGHIYGHQGQTSLDFYIVRADPPRWIEFIPRADGGGVRDMNVTAGDPRTQWGVGEDGKTLKPIATMFYDYVLCLWPTRELIALSLKSSGIKHAKSLNGLIKLRNAPLWSGKYSVAVADEPSANGPFPNYVLRNAGWVRTEEDAVYLKGMFDGLKGKVLDIERDNLDPAGEEPVGQPAGAGAGPEGDNIPF